MLENLVRCNILTLLENKILIGRFCCYLLQKRLRSKSKCVQCNYASLVVSFNVIWLR
uniref:Uncharacterized protein n=1 Tax=Arundo donax TaxID=35708 RepID=A0A0A9A9P8_ARUDO